MRWSPWWANKKATSSPTQTIPWLSKKDPSHHSMWFLNIFQSCPLHWKINKVFARAERLQTRAGSSTALRDLHGPGLQIQKPKKGLIDPTYPGTSSGANVDGTAPLRKTMKSEYQKKDEFQSLSSSSKSHTFGLAPFRWGWFWGICPYLLMMWARDGQRPYKIDYPPSDHHGSGCHGLWKDQLALQTGGELHFHVSCREGN